MPELVNIFKVATALVFLSGITHHIESLDCKKSTSQCLNKSTLKYSLEGLMLLTENILLANPDAKS